MRKVAFWVRVLDPRGAAAWYVNPLERWLTRLSGPLIRSPHASPEVRDFETADADQCAALISSANAGRDFSMSWNATSLRAHATGFGQCLVAAQDGCVKGFLSFHVLPFSGRTVAPVGIIDLAEYGSLRPSQCRALLETALARMHAGGAILCLKLRTGADPLVPMSLAGFIPWFPNSWQALRRLDAGAPLRLEGPQSILWR